MLKRRARDLPKIDLFVIGASAGGLEALKRIVAKLPSTFPASICLVMHVSPDSPGFIPGILSAFGLPHARHAEDGDALEPGTIYVAPPDLHLLVEGRRVKLGRGPKENRFRPAIDPLFRSAALSLDGRVAGVILSGGLDEGAAGLAAVKDRGGAAIVQHPTDAQSQSMPLAALRAVDADYCVPAEQIPDAMLQLVEWYAPPRRKEPVMIADLDKEVQFAAGADSHFMDVTKLGQPSLFTCPDCHGAMVQLPDSPIRFRCHTGHAYTLESLAASSPESVEECLWSAIRCLEEFAALHDHLADHHYGAGRHRADLRAQAEDSRRKSHAMRDVVKSLPKAVPDEPAAANA